MPVPFSKENNIFGALKLSETNGEIFIIDKCIVSLLFLPSEAPNFFLKFFFPMLSVKINTCVSYHSMFNVTQALENLFHWRASKVRSVYKKYTILIFNY